MTNQELLEEIRLNRKATKRVEDKVHKLELSFYVFKGKAIAITSVLSTIGSFLLQHYLK